MAYSPSKSMRKLLHIIANDCQFHQVFYYIQSMKPHSHSGVYVTSTPADFLKICGGHTLFFVGHNCRVPEPVTDYTKVVSRYVHNLVVDEEELLYFCFGVECEDDEIGAFNEWLLGQKLFSAPASGAIATKNNNDDIFKLAYDASYQKIPFKKVFTIDYNRLLEVFVCLLCETRLYSMNSIDIITEQERLERIHDKYGLCDITTASLGRQGFEVDGKVYLYNIFLDTSIGDPCAKVPKLIQLLDLNNHKDRKLFMRCDETLAVPAKSFLSTAGTGFEKWRGLPVNLEFKEGVAFVKSDDPFIIRYNPTTMNKLVIRIKPQFTLEKHYYDVCVEELCNPDSFCDSEVALVGFIHGCYYADGRFDHIDYSVNQYQMDVYKKKYLCAPEDTGVAIDSYADKHYKVWCVKGSTLDSKLWILLTLTTLSNPFRALFEEAVENMIDWRDSY